MNDPERKPATTSDRPPDDLRKERDSFIEHFFRKGAQLTEELLRENERLAGQVLDLEDENRRLHSQLRSDEAIRDLLRKIEDLELEKRELASRSRDVQRVTEGFMARYAELEGELAKVANLYVACSQLLAARSVRSVLRNVGELLMQLVGAASFAVYLAREDRSELVAIATEGVPRSEIATLPILTGRVGEAFLTGVVYADRVGDTTRGTVGEPAAAIPLLLDGQAVGVIAIFATLRQKTGLVDVDHELFKLLRAHAANSLVSASLLAASHRKLPPLEVIQGQAD